jgi:tuftelin-interacting protein 11
VIALDIYTVISRLQQVHLIVDDITNESKELNSTYEATLEPFTPHFHKLCEYPKEVDKYRLDEIVVAAIAPLVICLICSTDSRC